MDPSKRQASVGVFHLERPLKFQFIVFEGSFQVKCSHRNWKGGFPCNITDGPQCIVYTLWEFNMLASCYVKIIQILLLQPRFFSCNHLKKIIRFMLSFWRMKADLIYAALELLGKYTRIWNIQALPTQYVLLTILQTLLNYCCNKMTDYWLNMQSVT